MSAGTGEDDFQLEPTYYYRVVVPGLPDYERVAGVCPCPRRPPTDSLVTSSADEIICASSTSDGLFACVRAAFGSLGINYYI